MKFWTIALAAFTLAACGDTPVEKAQKDLDFIEKHHGTEQERCDAQQKLADAYRDARDDQHYELQALEARQCALNIELERQLH